MSQHTEQLPDESPAVRRERLRAEAAAKAAAIGIDHALIVALVDGFYDKVRNDDLLGPIFAARIDDWAPHLEKMYAFWGSVMMSSGVYRGQPMPKHVVLPIDAAHFDRWLALFGETADQICPPAAAAAFKERAGRIAQSLEMGVAGHHGEILLRDQRFTKDYTDSEAAVECSSSPCAAGTVDQSYMWAQNKPKSPTK